MQKKLVASRYQSSTFIRECLAALYSQTCCQRWCYSSCCCKWCWL